ncbi:kinase-like domain-containing protein [Suillus paluster]|uniref:kinase-like domain-containing protein n=1 Tax=Suillus paluster TaxID=48578 RepID=UPI001B86AE54|nr:kinase-like domain-containing protein [Suillus paluster]KAG1726257.1 kinase-like domain-containing protein [Suillus paluster]
MQFSYTYQPPNIRQSVVESQILDSIGRSKRHREDDDDDDDQPRTMIPKLQEFPELANKLKPSGACARCKSLKVRCEFRGDNDTCKRCTGAAQECVIPGRKPRRTLPEREHLLNQIREQAAQIQELMAQTGVMQGGGASQQPWSQSAYPIPSFGMNLGSGMPSAHQGLFPNWVPSTPPTASDVFPSTQLTPSITIPDLTGLITRCSQDPLSGGTYGNIYKCIYHGPGSDVEVAVKAIRPQFFTAEVFRRELGIWKRLRHRNILKFMGTTSDFGPSVALVAPWIVNGTLTSFLDEKNEILTLRDRLLLLCDVAAGLNYLHTFSLTIDGHTHSNPVVHGDLTGTNVLIGSDGTAYLADFGLSGTLTKLPGMTYLAKMSCRPGAVRWTAPELFSEEESDSAITTQSDIYSFGGIILQVLTGKVPWPHLNREAAILRKVIIEGEIHPRPDDDRVTDQQWNFMTRCWSQTPTNRPPAEEALQFIPLRTTTIRLHPPPTSVVFLHPLLESARIMVDPLWQDTLVPGFQWIGQMQLYAQDYQMYEPQHLGSMS